MFFYGLELDNGIGEDVLREAEDEDRADHAQPTRQQSREECLWTLLLSQVMCEKRRRQGRKEEKEMGPDLGVDELCSLER